MYLPTGSGCNCIISDEAVLAELALGAMMAETRLVVEHREQLWSLLVEAAQIEHMIMCQYLYACFSLKTEPDEGLTAQQANAVAAELPAPLSVPAAGCGVRAPAVRRRLPHPFPLPGAAGGHGAGGCGG